MDQHTLHVIEKSTAGSLDGTYSFPQVVGMLLEVGVSRYHVDYERGEKIIYLRNGESVLETVPMPKEPIGQEFHCAEVLAAVKASQTEGQPFPEFLRRTRRAGCVGYTAYLDGRRVVYTGRLGEEHVELFPS